MKGWVVLDRDGVINHEKEGGLRSAGEWAPIPGSLEAIAALSKANFGVVVATNQSGVARGLLTLADLDEIHQLLCNQVAELGGKIQGIFYCPHAASEGCDCRKPRTGLLDAIEQQFAIDLTGSPMVGDSLKDIQAARAKGCQPVLVRTGKGTQTETTTLLWPKYGENLLTFDDLASFAIHLIQQYR